MQSKIPRTMRGIFGATVGNRTRDLILTMDALYQLSYRGRNNPSLFNCGVVAAGDRRRTVKYVFPAKPDPA